jgi:dsRNA-specific ribonuclease
MATMIEQSNEIYLGSRGADFKQMITSFLRRGNLKSKYIDLLTSDDNMILYGQAFTSDSANPEVNYEVYEQLGDVSANKFIVWYAYKRFPQLFCPSGVRVVAQLRINYGSKKIFARIGETLGFWPFISASEDERSRNKKSLLEDVFEAIIGLTEFLLDNRFRVGVGYGIIYDILTDIFNNEEMSLQYDDLKPAKTRLKEFFDKNIALGELEYIAVKERDLQTVYSYLVTPSKQKEICKYCRSIFNSKDGLKKHIELCPARFEEARTNWIILGKGVAALKKDAEDRSADQALATLARKGFRIPIPESHTNLCK